MPHFAYRNNNPGNIRPNPAFTWQGQTGVYESGPSGQFLIFDTMVNGMRAVARLVANYPAIFGVDTMRGFFARYAPSGDGANDPTAYAKTIANAVGVGIDDKVDFTDYAVVSRMLLPIFRVETGASPLDNGITAGMVREACEKAGNVKGIPMAPGYVRDDSGNVKRENIDDSRTIKEADKGTREAATGILGVLGTVIASITNAPWYVSAPLALVAAVAIGAIVYRLVLVKRLRVEDHEAGVR
jgi:hypothetical protein